MGIRNEIWIIPAVGCVNDIPQTLVAQNQDLVTGSIDGLYAFPHPFGCSQTGSDHAQTRKLLAALARHPNAGAVAEGLRTPEESARELMTLVLSVASGEKTKTEIKGYREISIFKDGVVL